MNAALAFLSSPMLFGFKDNSELSGRRCFTGEVLKVQSI